MQLNGTRAVGSHPTWVRGLKPNLVINIIPVCMSHPTWVRGLKPLSIVGVSEGTGSHPTWVRGLKLLVMTFCAQCLRRTLRGCVD